MSALSEIQQRELVDSRRGHVRYVRRRSTVVALERLGLVTGIAVDRGLVLSGYRARLTTAGLVARDLAREAQRARWALLDLEAAP